MFRRLVTHFFWTHTEYLLLTRQWPVQINGWGNKLEIEDRRADSPIWGPNWSLKTLQLSQDCIFVIWWNSFIKREGCQLSLVHKNLKNAIPRLFGTAGSLCARSISFKIHGMSITCTHTMTPARSPFPLRYGAAARRSRDVRRTSNTYNDYTVGRLHI